MDNIDTSIADNAIGLNGIQKQENFLINISKNMEIINDHKENDIIEKTTIHQEIVQQLIIEEIVDDDDENNNENNDENDENVNNTTELDQIDNQIDNNIKEIIDNLIDVTHNENNDNLEIIKNQQLIEPEIIEPEVLIEEFKESVDQIGETLEEMENITEINGIEQQENAKEEENVITEDIVKENITEVMIEEDLVVENNVNSNQEDDSIEDSIEDNTDDNNEEEFEEIDDTGSMGPRMRQLHNVFQYALNNCLENCGDPQFSSAFPKLYEQNPKAITNFHNKMIQSIRKDVNKEFRKINKERNISYKLNLLDSLINRAHDNIIQANGEENNNKNNINSIQDVESIEKIKRVIPDELVRSYRIDAKRGELEILKQSLIDIEGVTQQQLNHLKDLKLTMNNFKNEIELSISKIVPDKEILDKIDSLVSV